jgi:hypothetical protein
VLQQASILPVAVQITSKYCRRAYVHVLSQLKQIGGHSMLIIGGLESGDKTGQVKVVKKYGHSSTTSGANDIMVTSFKS